MWVWVFEHFRNRQHFIVDSLLDFAQMDTHYGSDTNLPPSLLDKGDAMLGKG